LRRGEPHISTVDVAKLIHDAIALVRPLAASRQIRIDVTVPADAPAIHGDPVQLQQVIMNLVLNGIEAVTEARVADGRIELRADCTADAIEVAVADNGIGIPDERADAIFEPLNTSRPSGMGLGLSICKSIVEAHRGRIRLHTSRPGRTEFRFTIPIEVQQQA